MSAGIDIAGLALGILPIFVYAAGHYREGLDPLVTALHPGTRNRKLEDFYRDLHFEATLLHELLNRLFDELHGRSRRRSDSVLEKPELDIKPMESALQEKLGDAYQSFLEILQNSLRYFNHFVIDKGLNSVETRLDQPTGIFAKLILLQRDAERGRNKEAGITTLKDRIKFSSSEIRRQKSLDVLTRNNVRLERLLQVKAARLDQDPVRGLSRDGPPSNKIRKLVDGLYDAISKCWRCESSRHEAMLSLSEGCRWQHQEGRQETDMSIVVSTHRCLERIWHESEISITAPGVKFSNDGPGSSTSIVRPRVQNLCTLVHSAQKNDCHLCINFDGLELWQGNPKQKLSTVDTSQPKVSLATLLERSPHKVTLKEKRILAVVLARSLLHFCESSWITKKWSKVHISFLADAIGNKTNLQRPYVATFFEDSDEDTLTGEDDLFLAHPNASVLALGIMLIEIDRWSVIEANRTDGHLSNGEINVNTDLTTAQRLLDELSDDLHENHKSAIQACLAPEFTTKAKVSLEDADFRQGIYDNIVYPLELELFHGYGISTATL